MSDEIDTSHEAVEKALKEHSQALLQLTDLFQQNQATIATLTAERDAATSTVNHMSLVQLKLQQDLAAAEKERDELIQGAIEASEDARMWFDRCTAAEKVCEAAARLADMIYPESVFDGSSGDPGALAVVALRDALTDWRRTKEE